MRKRLAIRNKSLTKTIAPIQNIEEQNKKQVDQLQQLLLEDDFTVDQLYQTIQNSKQKQTLLSKLNKRKLEKFFAKHYDFLIESQEELSSMQLPQIDEIKRTAPVRVSQNFDFKASGEEIRQTSVLEIIDSFNNSLFDGDYKDGLRILGIIKQMAVSQRYQKYFHKLEIADVFRQSYVNWVESCNDQEYLLSVEQIKAAIKTFFNSSTKKIIDEIRTESSMGSIDNNMIGRLMNKLLKYIEQIVGEFKLKYGKYEDKLNVFVYSSNWIQTVVHEYYSIIESSIFQNQELSEILSLLSKILTSSTDLEARGISVNRIFKKLLCKDLILHFDRFIQVVLDAFESELKEDDNLYELTYFYSFKTFGEELACLKQAESADVSKVISTKKAILLINTYTLLLEPIFEKKWQFLHKKLLSLLCEKSADVLNSGQLQIWDYLNLYNFFQNLHKGKIRNKVYDNFEEDYKNQMKDSLNTINQFYKTCWQKFQEFVTQQYFYKFLQAVPKYLWDNGKIYASKQANPDKNSPMIPLMLKQFKEFFIQYIYRLSKAQIEDLITAFYQYFLYVCEYILYTAYHQQGAKESIFLLAQTDKILYQKAKSFKLKNIPEVLDKKVFKSAYMSIFGMKTFIIDSYCFATGVNYFYKLSKPVSAQQFLSKLVKIQEKQKKQPALDYQRQKYSVALSNFQQKLANRDYRVSREQQQIQVRLSKK